MERGERMRLEVVAKEGNVYQARYIGMVLANNSSLDDPIVMPDLERQQLNTLTVSADTGNPIFVGTPEVSQGVEIFPVDENDPSTWIITPDNEAPSKFDTAVILPAPNNNVIKATEDLDYASDNNGAHLPLPMFPWLAPDAASSVIDFSFEVSPPYTGEIRLALETLTPHLEYNPFANEWVLQDPSAEDFYITNASLVCVFDVIAEEAEPSDGPADGSADGSADEAGDGSADETGDGSADEAGDGSENGDTENGDTENGDTDNSDVDVIKPTPLVTVDTGLRG